MKRGWWAKQKGYKTMTNEELEQGILELIEQGKAIALLQQGEMKLYHIEHTDDNMLDNALPLEDVRRLMRSGEAE
jgi:hypothetical protein